MNSAEKIIRIGSIGKRYLIDDIETIWTKFKHKIKIIKGIKNNKFFLLE